MKKKRKRTTYEFVTSSDVLEKQLGKIFPISKGELKTRQKRRVRITKEVVDFIKRYKVNPLMYDPKKQNRFIERYLPVDEKGYQRLIHFVKEKKRMWKMLDKKRAGKFPGSEA